MVAKSTVLRHSPTLWRQQRGDVSTRGMMKWEDAKTALRQAAPLPIGTVELAFEGEFTRFSNLMPHRPADIDFR